MLRVTVDRRNSPGTGSRPRRFSTRSRRSAAAQSGRFSRARGGSISRSESTRPIGTISKRSGTSRSPIAQGRLIPIAQLADDPAGGRSQPDRPREPSAPDRHRDQRPRARSRGVRGRGPEGRGARRSRSPPGYRLEWGGQFENFQRASRRLTLVVPLALFLILLLLFMMFNTLRPALLIFLNVPVAATGGILALLVRGMPFSISAGVGFIALAGVAVMNGVVLVSYMIDQQKLGLSPEEAAFEEASTGCGR